MLDSVAKLDARGEWNSVANAQREREGLGAKLASERAAEARDKERAERQRVRSLPEGPEKYSPENVQAFLKSLEPPKWVQKHIKKSIGDAVSSMCDSVDRMKAACDDRRVIGGVGNRMTVTSIRSDSMSGKNAEHTLTIKFNGDFNMAGLIKHMHRMGAIGGTS